MDRPGRAEHQTQRPTAVRTSSKALYGQRHTPRWHHGRRRDLPCVAMLLPRAALRQLSKAAALAASDSILPHTGCSQWSGCTMDESHGVGTHSSTLCERGRAVKFTWASPSGGKHGAAAPALLRARTLPSSACSATLLPARQLATPATPRRCGVRTRGLKRYMERDLLHVRMGRRARTCAMRACERDRKTHLRKIASFSQILPT